MKLKHPVCAALALTAMAALTACSTPGADTGSASADTGSASSTESTAEEPAASDSGEDIVAEDSYGEGRIGDTMHTYFFDYKVNDAYTCTEFAGATPADGNIFLVADVTVHNTGSSSVEMYDTDFQAQWGSEGEEDFRVPITYDTENLADLPVLSDEQLPSTYTLGVDEERTGLLVYEVPSGYQDFSISYQELFDDDSSGDTFFVFFTAQPQDAAAGGDVSAV